MSKCDKCVYDILAEGPECVTCIHNDMRILADNFTTEAMQVCDKIIEELTPKRDVEYPDKIVVIAHDYSQEEADEVNAEVKRLRENAYHEGVAAAIRYVALIRRNMVEENK